MARSIRLLQAGVIALQRMRDGARRAAGKDHDPKAPRAQFGGALHASCRLRPCWPAAARASANRAAGRVHLAAAAQRLDEQGIDAAVEVALGAFERRLGPSTAEASVRARISVWADRRASSAARSLPCISAADTTLLPARDGRNASGRPGLRAGSSPRRRARRRAPCAARSAHCRSPCRRRRSPAGDALGDRARGSARPRLAVVRADVGTAEPRVSDRGARQVQAPRSPPVRPPAR